jgi:hypothetical protein
MKYEDDESMVAEEFNSKRDEIKNEHNEAVEVSGTLVLQSLSTRLLGPPFSCLTSLNSPPLPWS